MMKAFKCPECAAAVEVTSASDVVKCRFCGTTFEPAQRALPPPAKPAPPQRSGTAAALWIVVPLALFVSLGVKLLGKHGSTASSVFGPRVSNLRWALASEPDPWVGRIDDDDVEDFVGLFELRSDPGPDQRLYLGAFSGKTQALLWQAPIGTSSAGRLVHVVVSGRRVVATDPSMMARVYDLRSGSEVGKVALTDQADTVCVEPAEPAHVWVHTKDETGTLVDVAHATGGPAPRPAWCRLRRPDVYNTWSTFAEMNDERYAHVGSAKRAAPGFSGNSGVSDGKTTVVFGGKAPGTPLPMAVGFSASGDVLWSRMLSTDTVHTTAGALDAAALGGGLAIGSYLNDRGAPGGQVWIAALDVATGTTRWNVPMIPGSGWSVEWIVVGEKRVYVTMGMALFILDAATGAHLATVGDQPWP